MAIPIRQDDLNIAEMMRTITVKETLAMFGISDPKTVINACISGRLKSRKADAEYGVRGGVWLIDRESAVKIWGDRLKGSGSHNG